MFLPWSGLNLKEKSGRVILVEFNFDKMLCTNALVSKTYRLADVAIQGDIQAREYWEFVCPESLNIQNL